MLNKAVAEEAMQRLGLNQAALAEACGVSREAVSKWFAGESLPRPAKVRVLAEVLALSVDKLIRRTERPIVAYRTRLREPSSDDAKARAEEMGRHFVQLVPYLDDARLFTQRVLKNPSDDDAYVREVVNALRSSLKLAPHESPDRQQLIDLVNDTGAFFVPVIWGSKKVGHENALTVHLPESQMTWVVMNLAASPDDFRYWLAHELGHCLSMHRLSEEAGEAFSERFAQLLVCPDELAELGDERRMGPSCPSVAAELFGTDSPTVEEFVERSGEVFGTDVFDAIGRLQADQGGHSPAFVATLLNLDLSQALALSTYLSTRQP